MSRTERLLELLIALQTKTRFTVQELADEFGISRRTMIRDLHALSEMGVPLAATPGPGGGYSLIRSRRLLPLSLSPDEAIGILLSYEAFLQYAESPFAVPSLSAVTKLRQALPPDVVTELDRVSRHIAVTEVVRNAPAPFLADVLQAALDRVHLEIVYDSRTGVSQRRIFPCGLFASHGLWYCVCYDDKRRMQLPMRVDRIRSVRRVEGGEPPDVVPLREWLKRYRSGPVPMLPFRARIARRGARSLELETLFGEVPLDEEGQGRIESEIPASEIDYYASHLLTLGADLLVEEPDVLIEAIRERAAATAALYTRPDTTA